MKTHFELPDYSIVEIKKDHEKLQSTCWKLGNYKGNIVLLNDNLAKGIILEGKEHEHLKMMLDTIIDLNQVTLSDEIIYWNN